MKQRIKRLSMRSLLVVGLILYLNPKSLKAQYYTGPIAKAMGGAGRANTQSSQTVFLNPATIKVGPRVDISSLYQDGFSSSKEYQNLKVISIIDNSPGTAMTGGFQYVETRRFFINSESVKAQFMQVALADWFYKKLAVGVSLVSLKQNQALMSYRQITGNIGFFNPFSPEIQLALVFENISAEVESVPLNLRLKQQISMGLLYKWEEQFEIAFDLAYQVNNNPSHKLNLQLGLESLFIKFLKFRIGYDFENLEGSGRFSTGLGFSGPRLGLDYVFTAPSDGSFKSMHGVDFRLVF